MAHPSRLGSPILRFLTFVLVLGCVLLSPAGVWAKGCAESLPGPAQPPPSALWQGTDLEPGTILLDATRWTGSQLPNSSFPISTSVDIENGWVFHSFYGGFSIWDARTNPAAPARVALIGGFEGGFPGWPRVGEFTQVVFYIDAPEGNDNLAAIAAISPLGVTIWDTSNKTAPRELYQDTSKFSYQVYAARIGGRDYAFAADFQADQGLHVYDMTAAKGLASSPCVQGSGACPGVYLGRIGAKEPTKYVAGLAVGNRHFVVKSGGDSSGTGISIWEVTNPQQPSRVVEDFRGFAQFGSTHGVAMWSQDGHHYLAARQKGDAKIFDVTSCLTTGCSGLQNLEIWSKAIKPYPESLYWLSTTFSRSGNTPFVYFGNHDTCRQGEEAFQTEYLFNVSTPAAPTDVTPPGKVVDQGESVDYWSWYYSDTVRGYAHFGPRVAKFNGPYLYRAAATIFDIHQWKGGAAVPPVANFTWSPDTIYAGDLVTFTSTSTGSPTGYSWTFPDGNPPSATGDRSAQSTFSTPGAKQVGLTASNAQGQNATSKSVTVLNPAPAVGSITVTPASPLVCQPVTLKAENVTGKAPLGLQWTVNSITLGSSNPVTWNTAGLSAGTYSVNVTVSKAGYPNATSSTQVTLNPLPALPGAGQFTPTNDTFAAGTVQFHVAAAGATSWKWDFGDGTAQVWTSDPVAGPNPVHSYTQTGTYQVKVAVKNCVQGDPDNGVASAALPVTITQVAPLKINLFQAQGCQIFCDFSPNSAITFTVDVSGSPTQYEYDWNGNGFGNAADDQVSTTPITTHTYTAVGQYSPALRLRRGAEVSETWVHPVINIRTTTTPPPPSGVSVSGPNSGQLNTSYTFTATGTNCTPGTWTWSAGAGAAITGNGAATVQITWSSPGSKTVEATTSGCGSGSKTVNISGPNNTGGLTADFTYSPATPQVGQVVTFNGANSGGSPTLFFWEFGDGTSTFGTQVTHAFSSGTFNVRLTVYKDCTNGQCNSSASTTKAVVVGVSQLAASFDTSATCGSDLTGVRCSAQTGQAVSFTSTSTGATSWTWSFGDGTPAVSGAQASHTFSAPGSYFVQLTVGDGKATASVSRLFVVTGPPQLSVGFDTSANCTSDLTGVRCNAQTGQSVSFTATGSGGTSFSWSFGDGTPAVTGSQVSHTFTAPGSYLVQVTASDGKAKATATASRLFVVSGDPIAQSRSVVLPWIAQTRGALVQSSDLYVNNPGKTAMDVTLEFRKRGVPESNPPQAKRTIQPGATLYVGDVLRELFSRENLAGFITIKVDKGDAEPVITSFNTTFQADGKQFGQTVSGISMSSAGSSASSAPDSRMQHLVGLTNNTEKLAYFGISNPGDQPATYHLRFFDRSGKQIGESSQDLTLSRFGQRQYQAREIEELFGISNVADYRIEIETKAGGVIVPYASNLRLVSEDPAFIEAGSSKSSKSYLIGALSAPGLNSSIWQTDLLLSNISAQPVTAQVTFTSVGLLSEPTTPVSVTLQPGQSERLENIIAGRWGIRDAIGVLTVSSNSASSVFPIVQGESYESTNSDPAKRFGQSMTAVSDSDAAGAGRAQYLVGLRQDAKNRTTMWIFNPSTETAEYEITYLGLDGKPIAPASTVRLGAGKMRQFSPGQHPLPAAGVANGFTVKILVRSGKVLSSAQVINNVTNDPAYIQGEVR
jgi:PKD repeat protein